MTDDGFQESEADEFKSVFEIPRTYSGLLDDVVDRYKITLTFPPLSGPLRTGIFHL